MKERFGKPKKTQKNKTESVSDSSHKFVDETPPEMVHELEKDIKEAKIKSGKETPAEINSDQVHWTQLSILMKQWTRKKT